MKNYIIGLVLLLAAFSAGRFSKPAETKEVEKVVYKEREVKDEDRKTHLVRVVTVLPDGTKKTEIVRDTDSSKHSDTQVDSSKVTVKESKNLPNWSVGGYYDMDKAYSLTLDRRIIGGVFLGGTVRSDLYSKPVYGLGLRIEF